MIYTVTLNPALDKTVSVPGFALNAVNRAAAVRYDLGGKGLNVSRSVLAMGGQTEALCALGGPTGQRLATMAAQCGLALRQYAAAGETRTNTKIVDEQNHCYTDLNEQGAPVAEATLAAMLAELQARVRPGDVVVLAGSLPAGAPAGLYRAWVQALQPLGAQVFVDADGEALRLALEAKPAFLKPNREELERLCGCPLPVAAEVARQAQALLAAGVGQVLVSLGAEGALLATPQGVWQAEGLRVPVQSTVGAGDATVAVCALCAQRGTPPEEMLALAMAFAAATVATPGTNPPEMAQVQPLLAQARQNVRRLC